MTTSAQQEQKERMALLGSTREVTNYRDRAIADLGLESQGRHAQGTAVIGAARVPQYPAASGPWCDPVQVPDEPPLGYSVRDDLEPTGTPSEIEESLGVAASSAPCLVGADSAAEAPEEGGHSASARPAPSALSPLAADGANPNVIDGSPSERVLRRGRRL
jgi:hypothetical protein